MGHDIFCTLKACGSVARIEKVRADEWRAWALEIADYLLHNVNGQSCKRIPHFCNSKFIFVNIIDTTPK